MGSKWSLWRTDAFKTWECDRRINGTWDLRVLEEKGWSRAGKVSERVKPNLNSLRRNAKNIQVVYKRELPKANQRVIRMAK